jgi:hypothetical protein
MSATYAFDEEPQAGHPLRPGAAPLDIRTHLLPEDHPEFDADFQQAMAIARDSLDLEGLFKVLEHWRRVALLQSNPASYRLIARRAAELLTGEATPDDEPLTVTRAKAGM